MLSRQVNQADPQANRANASFIEFAPADSEALKGEWNFTDRAERFYQTGHRLLARGFFAEAALVFERATCHDPTHYDAYVGQAEALVDQGRLDAAQELLDRALDRYGRNCALGAARAHVSLHQNNFQHALECISIAMERDPDSAYVWLITGETRLCVPDGFQYAEKFFARCRTAEERWPHADIRIAQALLEWGHVPAALEALNGLAVEQPDIPLTWILRGDAGRVLSDDALMRESYKRALELAPELDSIRRTLSWRGDLSRWWGRTRVRARQWLESALRE